MENASDQGIVNISSNNSEASAQLLLALTDGTAFELIDHPEKLDDKRISILLRKMVLCATVITNISIATSISELYLIETIDKLIVMDLKCIEIGSFMKYQSIKIIRNTCMNH
jgi:hypothetical protein